MLKRFSFLILLASLLQPAVLHAQQSPAFNETVNVGYVVVPFVARDTSGKPLDGLRERDVKLLVDGQPVAFDMFAKVGDAPVSYTILLDGSGSMALSGKIQAARFAIRELLSRAKKGDDFALFVFAEGEVREVVSFTDKVSRIMTAANAVEPWGKTAFFDALSLMPDKSLVGKNGSRAIIILTDGFDNASKMTSADISTALATVDVPVFALGIRPDVPENDPQRPADALLDTQVLEQIARVTAGKAVIANTYPELRIAITEIDQELRAQYLLGFTPTGRGGSRYRKISLQLPRRARSVHVRAGYRGTAPPLRASSRGGK